MTEENRMLITKVKRTNETRADLFGKGHRYRDIICFDLAELADAGIDYEALPVGREVPCRFWAYFEPSDKTTEQGNPYLDLLYVEPVASANGHNGQATEIDVEQLLDKLDAIHRELVRACALLAQIAGTQLRSASTQPRLAIGEGVEPPDLPDLPPDQGDPVEPPDEERSEPERTGSSRPLALNEDQARKQFGEMAGPAIRAGLVDAEQVNELTRAVVATGWRDALQQLNELVKTGREVEGERVPAQR